MSNQSLDVLLCLPSELVFCILSEWVGLKELSGLDVAFCNHEKRDTLLAIFSSEVFVLGEEVPIGETNYIVWVTKRQIRQSEFFVDGNMSDYLEYVKVFGMVVQRVIFEEPHQEVSGANTMISALSYCKSLESLQIVDMLASETPLEAIWKCSSLRELRVNFSEDFNDDSVYQLAVGCLPPLQLTTLIVDSSMMFALKLLEMASPASLQYLQFSLSEDFEADALHAQLFKRYDLKALGLDGWISGVKLIRLLALCPNLRHLDVDCYDTDEDPTPEQTTQLAVQLSRMPLEVLRLGGIWYASELLTELSVRGCSTLRVLFLDRGGSSVLNIARLCKQLTELRAFDIGSDVFATIDLQQLCNLTHLMLGLSDTLHVKTVLDRVAINCTKLTYLALSVNGSDPSDFSALFDPKVLPSLSVFNLCHRGECGECDTSVLQMHRPNLRIGQADKPHWHCCEDIVCNEGYTVWKV